jgi:hypothetical protein
MKTIFKFLKRIFSFFKRNKKLENKSEIVKYPNDLGFWKKENKNDDTI